jgi:hypothetical protein
LPPLDEKVKHIKLKNAIEQQFAGSAGVFRQTNIEKRRVYNLPQWREVCESTDHQPPVKRGEVRTAGYTIGKRKLKPKKSTRKKVKKDTSVKLDRSPEKVIAMITPPAGQSPSRQKKVCDNCWTMESPTWRKADGGGDLCNACGLYFAKHNLAKPVVRPPSRPTSLECPTLPDVTQILSPAASSGEDLLPPIVIEAVDVDPSPSTAEPIIIPSTTADSQPSLKHARSPSVAGESSSDDEGDFQNFNYRITNSREYTVERCKELEKIYWKTVTFNNPMYGADLPGSLFDDHTDVWNVAKLDNLLCRIGKVIPGVNSAYLYLGMLKSTFSWHVEVPTTRQPVI